ncbi:hypothetical protein FW778_19410 [Ginsengibacter hankyongi]|uniref:Uncharacterized protein n=1 Tax=Ginsengibacter hankyongi TaxID=2607284 RepID=A0A5J5IBS3_9BACT|nr:hypothetical protein [Ginsengibacter hankyongi]KAA9036397.1 hypothetical protein FW778_19410 [Ginsengibacter hankyongi]
MGKEIDSNEMEPGSKDISIVVFANRKDFFLTKLCITSIRLYYPDVQILLVKDKLNGDFNTRRLRKVHNVEILDLGKKYYGWGAAKIHFLLKDNLPKRRYLCLDSDIVFVGRVLTKIQNTKGDFVFNPHYLSQPFSRDAIDIYFDPDTAKESYPGYEYPGYFFNAGQTVVTPGLLKECMLSTTFQTRRYPYYLKTFRCADQPILNMVMPVLKKEQNVEMNAVTYMILSPQFFLDSTNNDFEKFINGETEIMVHYAGDTRNNDLDKMRGNMLLKGIKKEYHLKLSRFSRLLDTWQDKICAHQKINRILYLRNRIWIELMNKIKYYNY